MPESAATDAADGKAAYKVEILPAALDDMTSAVRYVASTLHSPQAARDLARRFTSAADSLNSFPYSLPIYHPIRPLMHEYRRIMVGSYVMFYWVEEDDRTVTVARVIYARRDISAILR